MLTLAKGQFMDPEERKWKTMMYFILPWHLYSQHIKGVGGKANKGKWEHIHQQEYFNFQCWVAGTTAARGSPTVENTQCLSKITKVLPVDTSRMTM